MGLLQLNGHGWASKLTFLRAATRIARNKLGARLVRRGAALQGRLLQIALREGLDVRTGSPLIDLIEEKGKIVGAIIGGPGGHRKIEARSSEEHTSEVQS